MKLILTIGGLVLFVNLILPVESHFLYPENANDGYVSLNNGGESFPVGFNAKQRKYVSYPNGQTSQKQKDRANYKITKLPSVEPTVNDNRSHKLAGNQKPTETPKKQPKKEEVNYTLDPRNVKALRGKSGQNQNFKQVSKANSRVMEHSSPKQYEQNLSGKGNIYDGKANVVQVNTHKTQIAAEPQKVKLNSNRQVAALSVPRREDNYKKMPTSMLVDKTLQKSSNFKQRNAQTMSRVLDDMTKKVADRRVKSNEYKKRDTDSSYDNNFNVKRNIVSDNIKKYIVGKDKNILKEQPRDTHRIGSREEEIEETNAPYALFYRMSPESLDNHEGFYLMKSMENEGETVYSNKEKRLTVNYQNEVDLKKPKTKKNFNTVKLRKKVKNLSNFRNNNI